MDLRQLSCVVAVADEGGFTAAADALDLSQPAVSQAVRALEVELGAELFLRLGRSVRLTPAGEALLGPARQALRDAATARAAVADIVGLTAGHLEVVCLPTLAVSPTAALIGRFRQAHPDVTVRLAEPEDTEAVADRVRTGASEIGVTELPLGQPDLVAHPLEAHDYVAVLPPTGRSPARTTSLSALAHRPLIATPVGTSSRRLLEEAFAALGREPNVAVESEHREAIVALVLAGAGTAVLPRPLAATAAERGATVLELRPKMTRLIGLVHRPGALSPAAQAFVALAVPGQRATTERPPARRR